MHSVKSYRTPFSIHTIAVVVATAVFSACAPTAPAPTGAVLAPTAKPAIEQKAVFGYSNLSSSLDPHKEIGLNGRRFDLFDCLLLPDEKGEPQPAIATSWKIVDDRTWQFTIRSDMKWHDGSPLTAEDVKFSYDRALNPTNKLGLASRIATIDSTTAVDKTTVVIKTKEPDPILLRRLDLAAILPKAYIERVGPEEFDLKPVGSGPFKLKVWKPGQELTLAAFDEHPFRKPILREFTIKQVPEPAARAAGLQTGDLDYANLMPIEQGTRLKAAGFDVVSFDAGTSIGFFMDTVQGDRPTDAPTLDKRVRQAISYAVNKDEIAKQIFGGFTKPEGQAAQPATFGYNPAITAYPFDPKKAKDLLAEAGYPNGMKLKMEASTTVGPEFQPIGLLIQQQLKDVGIEIDFQLLPDMATQLDKFYGRQPRPALFGLPLSNRPGMDADFALTWFWSKQPAGSRHYSNPEFDRLYEASRVEMDSAKRRDLLQKAMSVMREDPPFLFLVAGATIDIYAPKRLEGVSSWVERDQRFDKIKRVG